MAQVLKRCDCPRSRWARCEHSWTVRYWDNGKQREKSFKRNRKQATAFAKTIEAEKLDPHRGDPPPPVTFAEYARSWIESGPGSPGTVRIYGQALRLHLLPAFGSRQLAEVAGDREGVAAVLGAIAGGSARPAYTCLTSMLSEAQRAGRITGHRLAGIRLEAAEPPEFTFPTHAQLTKLATELPEELRPVVWIMRGTGVRPGECLGLRKEDFANGHLRVSRQQMTDGTRGPLKARRPGEYRDVPVPGYVREVVDGLPGGDLFTVSTRWFNRQFAAAAKAAGLEGFRPHDLRHTFASVALSGRVPVTDVARWLGHRNIQVTYRTYSHFIPSSWETARAALDAEYGTWRAAA